VRRLKRQLYEAEGAVAEADRVAARKTLLALPGMDQFRDVLAMEYRRATTSRAPLAGVLFAVSAPFMQNLGTFANVLLNMLRKGEGIYRVSENAFTVILPGMELDEVSGFTAQAEKLSGIPRENLRVTIAAYPEPVTSLAELEECLSNKGTHLHEGTSSDTRMQKEA